MSRELEERVAFAEMARDTAIAKAEAQVAKYKAKCEVAGKKIAELMAENKLLNECIRAASTSSEYGSTEVRPLNNSLPDREDYFDGFDGALFNLDH
jgi:predicted transglutaminase-like cysteine proteinase